MVVNVKRLAGHPPTTRAILPPRHDEQAMEPKIEVQSKRRRVRAAGPGQRV
jgi:hypothetical protein